MKENRGEKVFFSADFRLPTTDGRDPYFSAGLRLHVLLRLHTFRLHSPTTYRTSCIWTRKSALMQPKTSLGKILKRGPLKGHGWWYRFPILQRNSNIRRCTSTAPPKTNYGNANYASIRKDQRIQFPIGKFIPWLNSSTVTLTLYTH